MKEIRLSKLSKAIAYGNEEEQYYFNRKNYMIYSIYRGEVRYVDRYRIATMEESEDLLRDSVALPVFSGKDCMQKYLAERGIEEDYAFSRFSWYLTLNDLEEDYEAYKTRLYRQLSIEFAEKEELVYIDDIK